MKIPVPSSSEKGCAALRLVAPLWATLCRYPASWSSATGCAATLTSMCSLKLVDVAVSSISTWPAAPTDATASGSPVASRHPRGMVAVKRALLKVDDVGDGDA